MKIKSLITHPHAVQTPEDLRSSSEHKWRYFWLNLRRGSLLHKGIETWQPGKSMKKMFKYSMWQQWLKYKFIKQREYFLCEQTNKNSNFIRLFLFFLVGREFNRFPIDFILDNNIIYYYYILSCATYMQWLSSYFSPSKILTLSPFDYVSSCLRYQVRVDHHCWPLSKTKRNCMIVINAKLSCLDIFWHTMEAQWLLVLPIRVYG